MTGAGVPDPDDTAEITAVVDRLHDAFDNHVDAVPERLRSTAQAAFGWRLVDQQLAELLFDSADEELVGIRGTSTDRRSFRYGAGDHVIRIHLAADSLVVMVEPPVAVACRLTTEEGTEEHRTDELGELVLDAPGLPLRLELDLPGGGFVTPWITG
jgi:hypothetical protein